MKRGYVNGIKRVVFDAVKLETYRVSNSLGQRDIANMLQTTWGNYRLWLMKSCVSLSQLDKFKKLEKICGIDLGLEIIEPMSPHEAEKYAKSKYLTQRDKVKTENYPKTCRRCPWRRGKMCLTPLCMKRMKEYDVSFLWGSHLEIYRKLRNEENVI